MKQAEKSREKISITVLGKILAVIIMILLCAISFGGIYVANKNSTKKDEFRQSSSFFVVGLTVCHLL